MKIQVYKNRIIWLAGIFITSLLAFYSCNLKSKDFYNSFGSDTFEKRFILSLTTTGEGEGTITSEDGGIDCPPDCNEDYVENSTVNLKVNFDPNTTNFFWTGDFEQFGSTDQIAVTMTDNFTGGVSFELIPPLSDVIPEGVFPFTGLTEPENPAYLAGVIEDYGYQKKANQVNFGTLTGQFITAFAGADGYQIIDLATGEVLKEETGLGDTGPFFGITGASQDPPGASSPVLIALAGANGFVLERLDQSGPTQFNGTTFDVFPAGGNPISNVITHVLPGAGIGFFVFDSAQNRYVPAAVGFPKELFGDVQLISAYMYDDVLTDNSVPQPRGNFLALSRETESGVFLVKWDGSDPVRAINNIGFDARRLRCIEDGSGSGNLICAASIFGHNRLGLMTWDGENLPVLTDFAEIGNGPVGIDLRLLSNGNIGIVSTGFNDNTITETIVETNGRVQSNDTRPVLDGCQSPGHAIYVEDAEGLKIVGTCYNSNNYFIVESEL